MPTKAISCKKEAICEHDPGALSCPAVLILAGIFDLVLVFKTIKHFRLKIFRLTFKSFESFIVLV